MPISFTSQKCRCRILRTERHMWHVPIEVGCQAWADFIYTTANTTSSASHPLHLHLGWRRTSRARLRVPRRAVPRRLVLSRARSAPYLVLSARRGEVRSARRGEGSPARARLFVPAVRLCRGSTQKASLRSSPRTLRMRLPAPLKPQPRRLSRRTSSRRHRLTSSSCLRMGDRLA